MNTEIEINKNEVLAEVEKTTGYTGAKDLDDENAYLRVATTDADRALLQTFWVESLDAVAYALRRNLLDIVSSDDSVRLCIVVSQAFETALLGSLAGDITHFLAANITAKWFAITDPSKSADYAASASALLDTAARKLHLKRKPTRPSYPTAG